MKTVYIIRHAKTEVGQPDQRDFDRMLNERGLRDAKFMATKLKEILENANKSVQKVISSSALRAKTTAGFFANELGIDTQDIQLEDEIYSEGQSFILKLLSKLNNNTDSVIVVGHNPDLTSFVRYLIGENIGHLVTCSITAIEFNFDDWGSIKNQNGKMIFHEFPKKYFSDANDD